MTEIEEECIRRIAEAKGLPPDAVTLDTSLDAIAVDSLDRVSLSFDLEEKYGIQIPETSLQQIQTVGDVAAAVHQAIALRRRDDTIGKTPEAGGTAGAA